MPTMQEELSDLRSSVEELTKLLKPEPKEGNTIEEQLQTLIALMHEQDLPNDGMVLKRIEDKINMLTRRIDELQLKTRAIGYESGFSHDTPEDLKFTKRLYKFLGLILPSTALLTVLSYNYIISAFPIIFGLFMTLFGGAIWVVFDEYFFQGNSLKRISQDAKAIGMAVIAIAIYFGIGVSIANTYDADPYGGSNERAPKVIIEQHIQQPTATTTAGQSGNSEQPSKAGQQLNSASRGNDVVLPKRTGKPESEQ